MKAAVGRVLLAGVLLAGCLAILGFFLLRTGTPDEKTIRVWAMGIEADFLPKLARKFEQENPGTKVRLQTFSWGDCNEKLVTAFIGGTPPDVCQLDAPAVNSFQAMGALENLDPLFDEGSLKPQDFFPTSLKTNVFDGHVFGLPWYIDLNIVFYRKDLLADFGLKEFPRTWAGLETLGEKVMARHRANGEPEGYFLGYNTYDFEMLYWQAGGVFQATDTTRDFFEEPALVAAMEYSRRLRKKGFYAQSPGSGLDFLEEFNRGLAPVKISGPWLASGWRREKDRFRCEWDVAPLPGLKTNATYFGGTSLVQFKDSRNKEEGRRFIRFLCRPDNQADLYRWNFNVPSTWPALDLPEFKDDRLLQVFREQLACAVIPPSSDQWRIFWDRFQSEFGSSLDGDVPLPSLARKMNALMKTIVQESDDSRFPRLPLVFWLAVSSLPILVSFLILTRGRLAGLRGLLTGKSKESGRFRCALFFLVPAVMVLVVFRLFPLCWAFVASFTDLGARSITQTSNSHFIGLTNYRELLQDRVFQAALWNTVCFAGIGVPINLLVSLSLALFLNGLRGWKRTVLVMLFFVPSVLTTVASAITWRWVLDPYNPVTQWVCSLGGLEAPRFLDQPSLALPALIVFSIWRTFGLNMIILLAALQAIPTELYDAVRVDGGNRIHELRYVTLPGLRRTLFVVVIGTIVANLQFFIEPYIMTGGGPETSTMSVMLFSYQKAFSSFRLGYSSAVIYFCFAFFILFNGFQGWMRRRLDE